MELQRSGGNLFVWAGGEGGITDKKIGDLFNQRQPFAVCSVRMSQWSMMLTAHLESVPSARLLTKGLCRLKNTSGKASSQSCLLIGLLMRPPSESGSPLRIPVDAKIGFIHPAVTLPNYRSLSSLNGVWMATYATWDPTVCIVLS